MALIFRGIDKGEKMFNNIEFSIKPIFILILFFGFGLIFILLKTKLKYRNHSEDILPSGVRIGNAQLIGQKDYQNDYFAFADDSKNNTILAVIADGIGNKKIGKYAPVISVEILKKNFIDGVYKEMSINNFFKKSFYQITMRLNDNIYGNKIGAAIAAIIIDKSILYYASIGECPIFLYRKGEMFKLNDSKSSYMQTGNIYLEMNDIAMLCTKGAQDSLTEMDIIWKLSEENHPYDKCQDLLERIRQKRMVSQDNATIMILEKML